MGQSNFAKIIKTILDSKQNKELFYDNINLVELKDKIIVIDISFYIYKCIYNNKQSILIYFINFINKLKKFNIKPIFVSDGKPDKSKNKIIIKRKKNKEKYVKIINDIDENIKLVEKALNLDDNEIENEIILLNNNNTELINKKIDLIKQKNKYKKRTVNITKKETDDLKNLFNLFKIPYIHLNYEADLICSILVKKGIAYACLSNDFDLIGFQCPIILKDLNFKSNNIKLIKLEKISNLLEINYDIITDLIILSGCDYAPNIQKNLNIVKVYNQLKDGIDISKVLEFFNYFKYDYQTPRNIFHTDLSINYSKDITNYDYINSYYKFIKEEKINNFIRNLNNDNNNHKDNNHSSNNSNIIKKLYNDINITIPTF